jgi:putative membrane-bound dehydrogenase-like protein
MPRALSLAFVCLLTLPVLTRAAEEIAKPRRPSAAGLDPKEAAAAMTAPTGFRVQLFAGEPDVKQPVAMALDDRGRLWVAEAYTYPKRAPEGKGTDRILIFEDADGDGSFDKRTVFADKLNLVSGLEVGFGGVWVGAAPYLLFLPDRDGDDKPDGPPEVLLDGWAYEDTHETLNTFIWGPDGWLYGCHGVFTHSNVGKPGAKNSERQKINAGIWRYHPTRHVFEIFAEGTSNPWGVDFNDRGHAFCTACVIPHLYHLIPGGRYQRQAGTHFNPHTYDDIKTIAKHRHWVGNQWNDADRAKSDSIGGGHAHAGAMIYLGGAWPAKYRDQLFMNNIHGARLNQDVLARKGSGYVGDAAPDFVFANDVWSQIINLRYGPDGQAYMIDWYDKNQCHHNDTNVHDRGNGRVFKIVYGEPKAVSVDLRSMTDTKLVALQTHANDWYVRHARRVLQERAVSGKLDRKEVHAGLHRILAENEDAGRRLRALWALHVTGGITGKRPGSSSRTARRTCAPGRCSWRASRPPRLGRRLRCSRSWRRTTPRRRSGCTWRPRCSGCHSSSAGTSPGHCCSTARTQTTTTSR